jgi:hypothetical protein
VSLKLSEFYFRKHILKFDIECARTEFLERQPNFYERIILPVNTDSPLHSLTGAKASLGSPVPALRFNNYLYDNLIILPDHIESESDTESDLDESTDSKKAKKRMSLSSVECLGQFRSWLSQRQDQEDSEFERLISLFQYLDDPISHAREVNNQLLEIMFTVALLSRKRISIKSFTALNNQLPFWRT